MSGAREVVSPHAERRSPRGQATSAGSDDPGSIGGRRTAQDVSRARGEATSGAALGRLCEVCADPVPDDVVPAETIAGGLQLECMACWMDHVAERMTLHPKPADL